MTDTGGLEGATAPNTTAKLVGHEDAGMFLAGAYRGGRIHHAVLIEGPKGIGKATLAFHFASHVLRFPDQASAPPAIAAPDVAMGLHRQIAAGAAPQLFHLTRPVDEKTGKTRTAITVDEVRRAGRLFTRTAAGQGWRIIIVDPADDLNRNAANALLKMLEEPPQRALFLLVSHAPGRLLPTIRSRCLALRLMPLSERQVKDALRLQPAARAMDENALDAVARLAQGSVSRAILILNYGGLDVIEAFDRIVADPSRERGSMHVLADSLSARDREDALRFFCQHVIDWLSGQAVTAGRNGNVARAALYAEKAERNAEELATAFAYNLDRKQMVLTLLRSASEALPL